MQGAKPERRSLPDRWLVLTSSGDPRRIADTFVARSGSEVAPAVEAVTNAREALKKIDSENFDRLLVGPDVTDSDLPLLARELRERGRCLPVVFVPEVPAHDPVLEESPPGSPPEITARAYGDWLSRMVLGTNSDGSAFQPGKRAEDTLRTLFRAIEQAADLVVITDSSGTIGYVNPAFEKLSGYSRAEAVGQSPRILKSGEQGAEFYRDLWQTIRAGETFRGVLVNRKKSGESYIVEKTITPVRNVKGEVAHFISNDRDISERRRLESALFQAQKMDAIGQLAGGVAHDFNNLLMVISSYAELMQDAIGPDHRLHRNVQEILSASRRAADLTRQLLAFGRKQMQSLQVLDLNNILRDISRMLPRLIGEDVELAIVPQTSCGRVKLDRVQIEQVIMNLAANARDAMPEGGKLTITTSDVDLDGNYVTAHPVVPQGRYVLLEVSDTGEGIDALHLPHIFELLYDEGEGQGYRARTGNWVWDREAEWWLYLGVQRIGNGYHVQGLFSKGRGKGAHLR
jgi:PAS domain S-box-containing protein